MERGRYHCLKKNVPRNENGRELPQTRNDENGYQVRRAVENSDLAAGVSDQARVSRRWDMKMAPSGDRRTRPI
jgi:hypothetical protein